MFVLCGIAAFTCIVKINYFYIEFMQVCLKERVPNLRVIETKAQMHVFEKLKK